MLDLANNSLPSGCPAGTDNHTSRWSWMPTHRLSVWRHHQGCHIAQKRSGKTSTLARTSTRGLRPFSSIGHLLYLFFWLVGHPCKEKFGFGLMLVLGLAYSLSLSFRGQIPSDRAMLRLQWLAYFDGAAVPALASFSSSPCGWSMRAKPPTGWPWSSAKRQKVGSALATPYGGLCLHSSRSGPTCWFSVSDPTRPRR